MSNTDSAVSPVLPNIRRLAWMAMGMGVVSLVCVAIAASIGASMPWWAWALPGLAIANARMGLLRVRDTHPRLTRWFPWLSLALALAIVVGQVFSFTGKF